MQNTSYPRIEPASDHALLVLFGDTINLQHHRDVRRLTQLLLSCPKEAILNIHPAYCSVLVVYNPRFVTTVEVEQLIWKFIDQIETVPIPESRVVKIPVIYGGKYGPDLHAVAAHNGLSTEEVIQIHSSGSYTVYFLGFAPGFAYMGGMSERIATPRLATPRTSVPAGSVAIGGSQTGIYPVCSPGGWRIIGRTTLELFRPIQHPPTLLQMGDSVRFTETIRLDRNAS